MIQSKFISHLIALCLFCSALPAQERWFDFQWMGATVDGREFKKAAILLPVKISGLKGNFAAQFDLGSDASELYGNAVKNYFNSKDALYQKLDTVHKSTSDNGNSEYPVNGLQVTAGSYPLGDLYFAEGFGDEVPKDSLYTASAKIIGTIGASFTKNKVLIIDFPKHRMRLVDSVSRYWSSRTAFVECRSAKGRIELPLTVNEKKIWVLFDTGASIFPLAVDSSLWANITDPSAKQDTMHIPSWGEMVPCYGSPVAADIYLGNLKMPGAEAWFMDNKRLAEFNRQEDISGLTGNAYFLQSIVVIDFKNKRFGVAR